MLMRGPGVQANVTSKVIRGGSGDDWGDNSDDDYDSGDDNGDNGDNGDKW